jgi:hypothetical protein
MLQKVKLFYDHLALRDPSHRAYKKVSAVLKQKGEPVDSLLVFTDFMYKYDVSLNKS